MNSFAKTLSVFLLFFGISSSSSAQDDWTLEQKQVLNAMDGLSETTSPDGLGAPAYGGFLDDEFSRWTIGSPNIIYKNQWVEGIGEWFEDGWRVTERKNEILELSVINNLAFTRRIVNETYLGPNGETSRSRAALSEIWVYEDLRWLLYRVELLPM